MTQAGGEIGQMPAGAKPNHVLCCGENGEFSQKDPAPGGVMFTIPVIFRGSWNFSE
jgi:Fe-S oxidoreductase